MAEAALPVEPVPNADLGGGLTCLGARARGSTGDAPLSAPHESRVEEQGWSLAPPFHEQTR